MTMAWGTMMVQDTSQMSTMLLRARFAVLLNIRGWQMAYQRSWAMQLRVRTETDTEMVWRLQTENTTRMGLVCSSNRAEEVMVMVRGVLGWIIAEWNMCGLVLILLFQIKTRLNVFTYTYIAIKE